jgi:hypothetical protein
VIQLYNADAFGCATDTEDGFKPGKGDESCLPHSLDYKPTDWTISLEELLRVIQLFNAGGYAPCVDGEDGYCSKAP